jgi:hypothetical protein
MSDTALGVLQQILQLPAEEQQRLMAEYQAVVQSPAPGAPRTSIMELQGLGKEIWQGVDVQQYLEEERNSWDG